METEKSSGVKRVIAPAIIAVVTMVALTVGATYAYFTITATNSFGSGSTATANISDISSVTLSRTTSAITMNIPATYMTSDNGGTTYYATSSGVSTTASTTIALGTATASGDGTFSCTYTWTATLSSTDTLIAALKTSGGTGEVILYVNGTAYDAYSTTFALSNSTTVTGITSTGKTVLTAGLAVTNLSTKTQNYLAGTSTTITFTISDFSCTLTSD